MSEIPHMVRTMSHAECVLYEDHVAAMQGARPQPKFKVGDRVTWKKMLGIGIVDVVMYRDYNNKYEYYFEGRGEFCLWESDIDLYVPPTPAELIRQVLISHGIDTEGGPHSWRCFEDRDLQPCSCIDELVKDLVEALNEIEVK